MKAVCIARAGSVQLRPRKLDALAKSVITFIDRFDGRYCIRIAGVNHQAGNVEGRPQLVEIVPSGAGKKDRPYRIVDTLKRQRQLIGVNFPLFIRRV